MALPSNTIGVPTITGATSYPGNTSVTIASDGTALVLWTDGTNQLYSTAAAPYTSWTSTTILGGQDCANACALDTGNNAWLIANDASASPGIAYFPLTKSGPKYTLGAETLVSTSQAVGFGTAPMITLKDVHNRYWVVYQDPTAFTCRALFSTTPATPTWTSSLTSAAQFAISTPAADIVGNYLVVVYQLTATTLAWQRLDVSQATLGSWSTAASITITPTSTPYYSFRGNGTLGVCVYTSTSGITSLVYNPATNTWSPELHLSSNGLDDTPSLVKVGPNIYCFWAAQAEINNFALLYKKWYGATQAWDKDASAVADGGSTVVNQFPQAGYGNGTVGVAWTVGQFGPYSVQFATIPDDGLDPPLITYGSNVAATTVTTSDKLATTTGGTETTVRTTSPASGANVYMEALSQGGSGTTNASLPAPTGKGWLLDSTILEGETIIAGPWSASIAVADALGSGPLASMTVRFYKRTSAGVYTAIGSIVLANPTVNTTRTVYTFPATSFGGVNFAVGDKLYLDFFYKSGASPWGSDLMDIYVSTSASAGVASDFQVATPGFAPTVPPKGFAPRYQTRPFMGPTHVPQTPVNIPRYVTRGFMSTLATYTLNVVGRFRLRSADAFKDITSRLVLVAGGGTQSVRDIAARLRIRSADKLSDIATQLRLRSADQLKDIAARLRLRSADQLRDVVVRLRLPSLKDIASRFRLGLLRDVASRIRLLQQKIVDVPTRFRLRSVDQLKDLATRLRLRSADQLKDIASRLRLRSADQLRDVASRMRLAILRDVATRLRLGIVKDVATRLRMRSADQLRDVATRLRLGLLKDITSRLRLAILKDIATRFILANSIQSIRDVATRFRIRSADQLKDIATRLRLGLLRDVATRLRLARLQDVSTRLRIMQSRVKDIATRLRLRSADQLRDVAMRLRIRSADQLKDTASRLRLALLRDIPSRLRLAMLKDLRTRFRVAQQVLKDTATRLRLRSADKLSDVATRLRIRASDQLRDLTSRLRLALLRDVQSRIRLAILKDLRTRLRLMSAAQLKDAASRLRLMSATQLRDAAARMRMRSADQVRDVAARLKLMSLGTIRIGDMSCRLILMVPTDVVWVTRDGRATWKTRDDLASWTTRDERDTWNSRDENATWKSRDEKTTWITRR